MAAALVMGLAAGPLDALAQLAVGHPVVPMATAAAGLGAMLARLVAVRRTLRRRVRFTLVPSDSFDPSPQTVASFAGQLARARRVLRDWLDGPGCAVRVLIDHGGDGVLRYALEAAQRDRRVLLAAASLYPEVQLIEQTDRRAPAPPRRGRIARAELVLARPSSLGLADVGLDPDPLQTIAAVIASGRPDLGDRVIVALDLRPVAPGKRRRLRRRLIRQARHRGEQPRLVDVLAGPDAARRRPRPEPVDLVARRAETRALAGKLGSPQPLLAMQLLLACSSPARGRAPRLLHALLSCFDAFAGENHLRAAGLRLPGIAFLGADLPLIRGRFDRRLATGRFAPTRRQHVTAAEVAGLLKPPSVHCAAANVQRSGGRVDPPPPGLPTFSHQPDLIPLGTVAGHDGEQRLAGVRVADTVFSYMAGRSRWGKTETAIGQFVHLVRSGHGGLFLDPHADALREIKSYLTDPESGRRVIEIDLSDLAGRHGQPAWNLFAAHGRPAWEASERVEAVADAFAAALGWDEKNTRALNLTTQAAQALVELSRVLPPELSPTLFQISTLLSDERWRTIVLPHVSPPTRAFFTDRFPRLTPEAITPVTNLVDRLRVARPVAALLGSPVSSIDLGAAMDAGQIVLVCPGSGGTRDRLVAAFVVYEALHRLKGRAQQPADRRRPFWLFLDELQTYDGPNLPTLLEQSAKFGGRCFMFNQNPERLTAATLNAVTTNRSHLATTAVNAKAAGMLAREWGGAPEPATLTKIERYTSVVQVTLTGRASLPFLVRGVRARELHADAYRPDAVAGLEETIDRTARRRPVEQTLAALDGHDERIAEHLTRGNAATSIDGGEDEPTQPAAALPQLPEVRQR